MAINRGHQSAYDLSDAEKMGTVGTADSLAELAQMLELFFKGLTECGLLTTYSVQLQATAVNFAEQMKFQLILQQFVTSLQKLLQKAPVPDINENNHDVEVQTVESAENVENNAEKEEFLELKMTPTTPTVGSASVQLGSLVENCIFAERQNTVEWVADESGSTDGLKAPIGSNLINENKTMGVTTDIIVTCQCHPSTLATINNQSFIATPLCEAVIATTPMKEANMVLMKQSHSPNNITSCTAVGLEQHSPSTVQETVTCETSANNYLQVATSTSPIEMKSFISTSSTAELPRVTFSSGQVSEPLVLESYEQGQCENISCITTTPNVMHIVLAETAKAVSISNNEDKEPKKDNVELTSSEKSSNANQVQHICEVCERTFRSSVSLEVHLSVKHRSRGECDICHQKFTSVLSLQEHCHAEHGGAGCFACMTCGRRFMTKLSYQRHVDTHKGKKGAVCDMCGKTFSRTDYLQKHYMTHTGHRPYRCQLCPKQFVSSSQLKVHQRIHTGEKEHVCEICKKAFSRGDKLKEHMMRHLNIKRFQCNHCSRDYAEKRDLTKHLKVHNAT